MQTYLGEVQLEARVSLVLWQIPLAPKHYESDVSEEGSGKENVLEQELLVETTVTDHRNK